MSVRACALRVTGTTPTCNITRARTLLGYEPEYDVRQGLRLAGDWYDAHL